MKRTRLIATFAILAVGVSAAFGQTSDVPQLSEIVQRARTHKILHRTAPPSWLDFAKIKGAFTFLEKKKAPLQRLMQSTSIAATYAPKDVMPVVMVTHKSSTDFSGRMEGTMKWMREIFAPTDSEEQFRETNMDRALELGRYHRAVALQVEDELKWDPKVKAVVNQQAYAFVLYSLAYWPIEAMVARKQLDPVADRASIDDWLHLWSVIGYTMGVEDDLLPRDLDRAQRLVKLLRDAQYPSGSERPSDKLPGILGEHVLMLARRAAPSGTDPLSILPTVAKMFGETILLSPGMAEAMGLGTDPSGALLKYAQEVAAKKK